MPAIQVRDSGNVREARLLRFAAEDDAEVRFADSPETQNVKRGTVFFTTPDVFLSTQVACVQQLVWFATNCPPEERHWEHSNIQYHLTAFCDGLTNNDDKLQKATLPLFRFVRADENWLTLYSSPCDSPCAYLSRCDSFQCAHPFQIEIDKAGVCVRVDDREFAQQESIDAIVIVMDYTCMTFPVVWMELFTSVDTMRSLLTAPVARRALIIWLKKLERCLLHKDRVQLSIDAQTASYDDCAMCGVHMSISRFLMHTMSSAHFCHMLDTDDALDPELFPASFMKGVCAYVDGNRKVITSSSGKDGGRVHVSSEEGMSAEFACEDLTVEPVSFLHAQLAIALRFIRKFNLPAPKDIKYSRTDVLQLNCILKHNPFSPSEAHRTFLQSHNGKAIFAWIVSNIVDVYDALRNQNKTETNVRMANRVMLVANHSKRGPLVVPNLDHDFAQMFKSTFVLQSKYFLWQIRKECADAAFCEPIATIRFSYEKMALADHTCKASSKRRKKKKKNCKSSDGTESNPFTDEHCVSDIVANDTDTNLDPSVTPMMPMQHHVV